MRQDFSKPRIDHKCINKIPQEFWYDLDRAFKESEEKNIYKLYKQQYFSNITLSKKTSTDNSKYDNSKNLYYNLKKFFIILYLEDSNIYNKVNNKVNNKLSTCNKNKKIGTRNNQDNIDINLIDFLFNQNLIQSELFKQLKEEWGDPIKLENKMKSSSFLDLLCNKTLKQQNISPTLDITNPKDPIGNSINVKDIIDEVEDNELKTIALNLQQISNLIRVDSKKLNKIEIENLNNKSANHILAHSALLPIFIHLIDKIKSKKDNSHETYNEIFKIFTDNKTIIDNCKTSWCNIFFNGTLKQEIYTNLKNILTNISYGNKNIYMGDSKINRKISNYFDPELLVTLENKKQYSENSKNILTEIKDLIDKKILPQSINQFLTLQDGKDPDIKSFLTSSQKKELPYPQFSTPTKKHIDKTPDKKNKGNKKGVYTPITEGILKNTIKKLSFSDTSYKKVKLNDVALKSRNTDSSLASTSPNKETSSKEELKKTEKTVEKENNKTV
jgi:hypothetical protein